MHAGVLGEVVFGEHAGVGVGVVAADDDDGLDAEFLADFKTLIELVGLFEFGASGADDVEAAGVAVVVDDVGGELDVLMVDESRWAAEEAVEFAVLIEGLDAVEYAGDDVVAARGLSAGEDYADVEWFGLGSLISFFEGDDGHAVGVGEEFLDVVLVGDGGCGLAFSESCSSDDGGWHLGSVFAALDLQCTLAHY